MSILAENEEIKELLFQNGIEVETVADIHPIHVQPSKVLSHIYARLGKNLELLLRVLSLVSYFTELLFALHFYGKLPSFSPFPPLFVPPSLLC